MAEKQFFPLLPKLKESSSLNPDKSSVWEKETGARDFLLHLVQSLAVSGSIKDIDSIDSIPDIWAKPLLFQMALYDNQKNVSQEFVRGLHERVVGEWRALLAMIALKDRRHLNLTTQAVHLGGSASSLEEALSLMAPKESIEPGTTWNDIYILFLNDIPIALTSPTTLLAAAADYSRAFGGNLPQPWSQDGKILSDPLPYLPDEDLTALREWLRLLDKNIIENVPRIEQDGNAPMLSLRRLIEEYMQGINHFVRVSSSSETMIPAGLDFNVGIYRALNFTVKASPATAQDSAVKLCPSPTRDPKNEILLVSEAMVRDFAAQEGLPASQLVVWQGLSANDISALDLTDDHNKIGIIPLGNAEYRQPEDFFTERMTVMEPGTALPGTLRVPGAELLASDDMSVILPLKKEILDYFTPEEIAQRLRIENLPDRITVQFSFPLSGPSGRGSEYRFTKEYPKQEIIYLQNNVPVIELWPNVKREGWKKYYLYYENMEAQNKNSSELGRDFFYVYPWAYGEDIAQDVPEHGLVNRFTARLTGFPEALICTVNASMDDSLYAQPIESGILLLNKPKPAETAPTLNWKIGVDFGTSSTMIYYRSENKQPQPLVFAPNLYQVTDSGIQRNMTYLNFIPSSTDEQQDGSFLSIFHLLDAQNINQEIRPLQDGHIFWMLSDRRDMFNQERNRVDANLKWQDGDTGRRKVSAYIKQICLQALAEAAINGANKVEWNFSYPTAFSKEQQATFQATCQEAVIETYEGTGFTIDKTQPMEPWSESKASAYHFNKLEGNDTNFTNGAICLDIGAGTTDISIISGQPGKIVYHTSIYFAGRSLFRPIYKAYALFAGVDPGTYADDDEARNVFYDTDMRAKSEEYLKNLKNITGQESVKSVLQSSQFAMAGIFYYLGKILGKLKKKGVYEENHIPDVFVGGNGSRIFYWLSGGAFNPANPFLGVFKDMLMAGSELADSFHAQIHLSSAPKVEVASGMIEDRPNNDAEFYDEARQNKALFANERNEYVLSSVLAGDKCSIDGKTAGSDKFISALDISSGINVSDAIELKNFIKHFNDNQHIWHDGLNLTDDLLFEIIKKTNGHYVAQKGLDAKKIRVDPIFIVELAETMEMLPNE